MRRQGRRGEPLEQCKQPDGVSQWHGPEQGPVPRGEKRVRETGAIPWASGPGMTGACRFGPVRRSDNFRRIRAAPEGCRSIYHRHEF